MNLVCNAVFFISAVVVILYDYRLQKIPVILILLNYSSICLLVSPYLLAGNVAILVLKKLDKSVDIVYIALLAFYLTVYKDDYNFLALIPMIIQVLVTKKEKISFMISIELAYTILMTLRIIGEFS